MENYNPSQPPQYYGTDAQAVSTQVGTVMRKVYFRMFIGLIISAFCAMGVASSPALIKIFAMNQIVYFGMWIAMLAIAFIIPSRLTKMSSTSVLVWFCVFSALMGASLSYIFFVYQLGTIVYTFFITAGTFGIMSLYGYFTKANLAKVGQICFMGLIGIIIACVVNIFLHSERMEYIISIIGVLLFVGLTAWDTQWVKRMAESNLEPALSDKLATMGAMNLYLDFINLFLFLLRIFGGGRK